MNYAHCSIPGSTDSSTQTITLIDKDQLAEDMADSSSAHNFNENGQQNVLTGLECAISVEDETSLHVWRKINFVFSLLAHNHMKK